MFLLFTLFGCLVFIWLDVLVLLYKVDVCCDLLVDCWCLRLSVCCLLLYVYCIVRLEFRFAIIVSLVCCWVVWCFTWLLIVACCLLVFYYCYCVFDNVAFSLISLGVVAVVFIVLVAVIGLIGFCVIVFDWQCCGLLVGLIIFGGFGSSWFRLDVLLIVLLISFVVIIFVFSFVYLLGFCLFIAALVVSFGLLICWVLCFCWFCGFVVYLACLCVLLLWFTLFMVGFVIWVWRLYFCVLRWLLVVWNAGFVVCWLLCFWIVFGYVCVFTVIVLGIYFFSFCMYLNWDWLLASGVEFLFEFELFVLLWMCSVSCVSLLFMVYCVSLCVCFNVGLFWLRMVGLFNSVASIIFYYVCFSVY